MKKVILSGFLLLLFSTPLLCQQISNVQQKIENGRIIITYDLSGDDIYNITLTATNKDGTKIKPEVIAGDLENVKPGKNHKIWWEPVLEGRDLQGWNISLIAKKSLMVFVKGGTFQMGSNDGEDGEKPVHTVTVDDFYIGKYEVTQKEWKEVMGNNPSYFKGDNSPVEEVSWYDAVEFCNKLSKKEGLTPCYSGSGKNTKCDFSANGYRLPTEAEWEYAALGGNKSRGYKYSGSNTIGEVAWYGNNSGSKTHPVGKKQPNELGIYDMSGNVWEWCWDWHDKNYYSKSPKYNPKGPGSCKYRVLRGGSWDNYDIGCRSSNRISNNPGSSYYNYGFRFLRTLN